MRGCISTLTVGLLRAGLDEGIQGMHKYPHSRAE